MRILRRLVLLALAIGFGYAAYRFANANAGEFDIDLIYTTWQAPGWLALLAAFGLGAVLTGLLMLLELARMGLVARRYRKAVRGLESEVHQLRNLPLAESDTGGAGPTAGTGGPGSAPGASA